MITRNNITEVAYNVQTTVDEKNNLTLDYKVTNTNDSKAMGNMLRRAKTILGHNNFTALYDKRLPHRQRNTIRYGVRYRTNGGRTGRGTFAPDDAYNFDQFIYHQETQIPIPVRNIKHLLQMVTGTRKARSGLCTL